MTQERQREIAYHYWQTLNESDRINLAPCYGEVSMISKNSDALDKLYTDNFIICYTSKQDYILEIIQGRIERGIPHASENEIGHVSKICKVRMFETLEEKEAYLQALEDNNIYRYMYPPFLGVFLAQQIKKLKLTYP